MKTYTLTEISKLCGLSKKEIRKHLIAQTLKNTPSSSGYKIEESDLNGWLSNIPSLDGEFVDSIFLDSQTIEIQSAPMRMVNISKMNLTQDWKHCRMNHYKFADFFCGAGGLSLGLVMAGYKPVMGVEIDEYAYQTYLNNLGQRFKGLTKFKSMDITNPNVKQFIIDKLRNQHIDIICGGFPCQGFSLSGSRVISDPRNTLYSDMLDIVEEVQPNYIIMENVLGIETIFDGKVIKKILNDYHNIGYEISYQEINAADYGVAQNRQRLIFVGNRLKKENVFPAKLITNPSEYVTCGEVLDKYKTMDENIAFSHIFSKHSKQMQERLLAVELGDCLYDNYNDSWKKCPKDKPSCTIKGNHGATNIHYELPRVITPREMAALQSFPDDYLFVGTKQSQLVQIGNAVPPFVSRAVGLALLTQIKTLNKD